MLPASIYKKHTLTVKVRHHLLQKTTIIRRFSPEKSLLENIYPLLNKDIHMIIQN